MNWATRTAAPPVARTDGIGRRPSRPTTLMCKPAEKRLAFLIPGRNLLGQLHPGRQPWAAVAASALALAANERAGQILRACEVPPRRRPTPLAAIRGLGGGAFSMP